MNFFDIHCHIYELKNLEQEIKICKDLGFFGVLCVSEDLETMEITLNLKEKFKNFVYAAIGIHPCFISLNENERIKDAFNFLTDNIKYANAMGEIGLDFKYAKSEEEKNKQIFWLSEQIKLAKEEKKPLNLHSRRALREVMEIGINFRRETGIPVLLHWFTHSKKLIKISNENNLFISAGPSVIYNEKTFETAMEINIKNLTVESDCPVEFDGKPSKPSDVIKIYEKFSKKYEIEVGKFSNAILQNVKNYLKI